MNANDKTLIFPYTMLFRLQLYYIHSLYIHSSQPNTYITYLQYSLSAWASTVYTCTRDPLECNDHFKKVSAILHRKYVIPFYERCAINKRYGLCVEPLMCVEMGEHTSLKFVQRLSLTVNVIANYSSHYMSHCNIPSISLLANYYKMQNNCKFMSACKYVSQNKGTHFNCIYMRHKGVHFSWIFLARVWIIGCV